MGSRQEVRHGRELKTAAAGIPFTGRYLDDLPTSTQNRYFKSSYIDDLFMDMAFVRVQDGLP